MSEGNGVASKVARSRYLTVAIASVGIVLLGGLVWSSLGGPTHGPSEAQASASAVPADEPRAAVIEASRVSRTNLILKARTTGHLEPWRQVKLSFDSGGKIVSREVEIGQWVEAGAPLLRLDDRRAQAELAEAEAELLKIKALHAVGFALSELRESDAETAAAEAGSQGPDLARRPPPEFERHEEVQQLLSGEQQSNVRAATSGLSQVEQRVARARLALEQTVLRAPFTGRGADLRAEVGQQITSGDECLTLMDNQRLKVVVNVLESDMVWLRVGARAHVQIPSLEDAVFEGRVHAINPRVDPETGAGEVTVALHNTDRRLLPGLFTFVELELRVLENRLRVSADAILHRQQRDLVFRVVDNRALWTFVTPGVRAGEDVEILDGLEDGDLVATAGHFALAHGAPVELLRRSGAEP